MQKLSQTATEYLVILGVVVVIGLVTVSTLSDVTQFGSDSLDTSTKIQLASMPIGVESYFVGTNHSALMLQNNLAKSVRVTDVFLEGISCNNSKKLGVGEKYAYLCPTVYLNSSDEYYSYQLAINYVDPQFNSVYVLNDSTVTLEGNSIENRLQVIMFDGTTDWIDFNDSVNLSGDFYVEFQAQFGDANSHSILASDQNSDVFAVKSGLNGYTIYESLSSEVLSFDSALSTDTLYTFGLRRISGVMYAEINGVTQSDTAAKPGVMSFSRMSEKFNWYVNGTIFNLKIDDGNDGSYEHMWYGYGNTNANWVDQIGNVQGILKSSPKTMYVRT